MPFPGHHIRGPREDPEVSHRWRPRSCVIAMSAVFPRCSYRVSLGKRLVRETWKRRSLCVSSRLDPLAVARSPHSRGVCDSHSCGDRLSPSFLLNYLTRTLERRVVPLRHLSVASVMNVSRESRRFCPAGRHPVSPCFAPRIVRAAVIARSCGPGSACSGRGPLVSRAPPCFPAEDAPGRLVFPLLQP